MDLILFCLIILVFFIQMFNTISNVYLMKLVIKLSSDNNQLKTRIRQLDKKAELQEWTLLKLLQVLRSQLLVE